MVGDILKIKTNIPPLGTNILSLPRILESLDENLMVAEGFTRQLTLLSAPAGFGKTTLVRKWLAGCEDHTAWYSLDDGDNEPERFWLYFITALQKLKPGLCSGLLDILRSQTMFTDSSTSGEALLIPLLNDLFVLEGPFFLILDDYHLINNPRIHEDLVFFIENLHPTLHLAITTRSDPPWPLFRWRVKGKMAEFRLKDLKLSEEEAGQLLTNFKGIRLSDAQLHLDIPFEGKTLAGYFIKAGNDGKKRKTLLMIGGGETFAEDLYFYIGPHALKRGYNFATADLPGQGITPFDGMTFRPDTEVPMGTILDYVSNRPEVDTDRVAAYGISGGGYYVPRAACHDKRIKACIANSLLSDLEEIFAASPVNIKNDESALRMIEALAWRRGVKEGIELIEKNKDFKFDCSQITNPLLIVVGEGEYQNQVLQKQVQECMKLSKAPRKDVVMTPINEGAGHHCQGENTALMAQVVFDWLDELFD